MGQKNKRYTEEFKREALEMARSNTGSDAYAVNATRSSTAAL